MNYWLSLRIFVMLIAFYVLKKLIVSLLPMRFKTIRKLGTTIARLVMEFRLFTKNAATGHIRPTVNILSSQKPILITGQLGLLMLNILNCLRSEERRVGKECRCRGLT